MTTMATASISTVCLMLLSVLYTCLVYICECPSLLSVRQISKMKRKATSTNIKRQRRSKKRKSEEQRTRQRRVAAIYYHWKLSQHECEEQVYYVVKERRCQFKCEKQFRVRKKPVLPCRRRRKVRRHIALHVERKALVQIHRTLDKRLRKMLRLEYFRNAKNTKKNNLSEKSPMTPVLISDEHIEIFVQGMNNKTYTVNIDPIHQSVSFLKEQIGEKAHLNYNEFYLTLHGKPLNDKLLLREYCLYPNAHVVVHELCLGGVGIGPTRKLPSHEEIRDRVNSAFDKLLCVDENGGLKPYVCTICDEIIDKPDTDLCIVLATKLYKSRQKLAWKTYVKREDRIPDVEAYYQATGTENICLGGLRGEARSLSWMKELALSPNGSVMSSQYGQQGRRKGFTCCKYCRDAIKRDTQQYFSRAIANNNFVGATPDCLNELTEVELGLLTPLQSYGYCFTYTGGKQRNMKGTLVYMRIKRRDIVRGIMQLEALGLSKNVIVIASGKMTAEQQRMAKNKSKIRTDKVIEAAEWLCRNNRAWKDKVNIDDIRTDLAGVQPTFLDHSTTEEGEDSNIERNEIFSCYFPESSNNNTNGGFEQPGDFRRFVEQMQEQNAEIEFVYNLEREFTQNNEIDEFVEACLLQFPYGVGGLKARRLSSDGKTSTGKRPDDIEAFINHMTKMSQPQFHHPLFILMLYNLCTKTKLLQRAFLQVPQSVKATNIANGLTVQDLTKAAEHRRNGRRNMGTQASQKLLNAVDACSRAIPHTNDAAKAARSTGESMQHHFGTGSIFLTVTYDDENSVLVQVLSKKMIDDGTDVSTLSDEELEKKIGERRAIRLKFPGITAMTYGMLNRILFRDVIGWDIDKCEPTENPGIFGKCEAVALAVEEQGRKTLHGHFTIWIEGYNKMLTQIHNGSTNTEREIAEKCTANYVNHVNTTKMFQNKNRVLQQAFHHDCTQTDQRKRKLPEVVPDQQLRNLRHRHGYRESAGKFAFCPEPECTKEWTYEELLANYLVIAKNIRDETLEDTDSTEIPLARMKAMIVEYQRSQNSDQVLAEEVVNATYQHHKSCHVKGCFKCSGKRKHICGPSCECRFRLPDCKRRKHSNVRKVRDAQQNWFLWTGKNEPRYLVELLPTRGPYDLFQNVSCSAISSSKFTCNNNCAPITPGPLSQYMFKYNFKKTQDDDSEEYDYVIQRMKQTLMSRKHEEDRNEAMRLIIAAAFAHQKTNVIGASMASYIMRNDARFYFSHQFAYCPLRDLVRILHDQPVAGTLQSSVGNKKSVTYFENCALNYLCRNAEHLEDVSVADFFVNFRVTHNNEKDENCFAMEADTGFYQHPSANSGTVLRAVVEEKEAQLLKVSQWEFPDTATFGGDITSPSTPPNKEMEKYAMLVLILFVPFRCSADLKLANEEYPYLRKLRKLYEEDINRTQNRQQPRVFSPFAVKFLQNVQDARSNCLRIPVAKDELQSRTNEYQPNGCEPEPEEEKEDEVEYDVDLEEAFNWLAGADGNNESEDDERAIPKTFRLSVQQDKGKNQSGYNTLKPSQNAATANSFFNDVVPSSQNGTARTENAGQERSDNLETEKKKYSMKTMVRTLFKTRDVNAANASELFGERAGQVLLANGSVTSILNWAELARLDDTQKRAFECILAAFLLSFYEDPDQENVQDTQDNVRNVRTKYRVAYNNLKMLRGVEGLSLVCLLHGPGGSGKSTVINLVKAYAKEFCQTLGHEFTSRTITITAMSGVAATLINGETTHKALGLNKKKAFGEEEKEVFHDTRLVIVDEISFAGKKDFAKMDENLRILKRTRLDDKGPMYGGVNMVFAGDYSQLEPIHKSETVYDGEPCPTFQLTLNCYIELNGMHRFSEDMEWGRLLRRFREGNVTLDDIRYINTHCLAQDREIPAGVQAACFANKERNAINSQVFHQYCKEHLSNEGVAENAALIFMDDLHVMNSDKVYNPVRTSLFRRHFYENCGDASIEYNQRSACVDSVLKLYTNCPLMMMTENNNVPAGQANGSRLRLLQINKKAGELPEFVTLDSGAKVCAYTANQIESLLVEHTATNVSPKVFEVRPKNYASLTATVPDVINAKTKISMKGTQFPLVSNSATTGHKLQGSTVSALLVNDWRYQSNWVYVVLSRVKKMEGLFIQCPLSEDLTRYELPDNMRRMLDTFRERHLLQPLSSDVYERMKNTEEQ